MDAGDTAFVGSIPALYERLLVPMVFAEPARRTASTIAALPHERILETAAGTGVLTRALVEAGAPEITATDLNAPMLDTARELCASEAVRWQVADATALPFDDGAFDVVACQFGVMFFPDKPSGFAEARRVLAPGGAFVFTAWDRIEANPAWRIVSDAVAGASAGVPVDFLRRAPYSYFDGATIRRDLAAAGYDDAVIETLSGTSESTADETATAICQGTPLRTQLVAHPTVSLDQFTAVAAQALRDEYGGGPFTAPISWLQVTARKS